MCLCEVERWGLRSVSLGTTSCNLWLNKNVRVIWFLQIFQYEYRSSLNKLWSPFFHDCVYWRHTVISLHSVHHIHYAQFHAAAWRWNKSMWEKASGRAAETNRLRKLQCRKQDTGKYSRSKWENRMRKLNFFVQHYVKPACMQSCRVL